MKIIKKLVDILTAQERKRLILLLAMTLILAFLEMIGLVSILPFMATLSNPEIIESNKILNNFFQASKLLGIKN